MKKSLATLSAVALGLAMSVSALATTGTAGPNNYTLFDGATYVSPGHASNRAVQLTSNASTTDSGIDFTVAASTTFADIQNLATDYLFTAGSCGGGSPRFQINVDGVNAFVYIGPPPNYTGCPQNTWLNTGNLATPASFVDTSQLPGGAFYDTFAAADAKYGTMAVTGIQLVADGGWVFPPPAKPCRWTIRKSTMSSTPTSSAARTTAKTAATKTSPLPPVRLRTKASVSVTLSIKNSSYFYVPGSRDVF